jgi:hypothetical protein
MTRLVAIAVALLACAACLATASLGASHLGPWLQSHMVAARWFMPACNFFILACVGIATLRRKKAAKGDDERLTPLVRRDPKTGLRQL